MKTIILITVTFFFLNIFSCVLHPQEVDLVKLKKEEEERKKKTKKSKYVLTNDNLDKIDVPKKPYALIKVEKKGKGSDQTGVTSTSSGSNNEGEGKRTREYWQQEKKKLLDQINEVEAEINKMQDEYNRLMYTYPAEDILTKRISMKNRMDELFKIIPEHKKRLENLKKELEALEDRARKAGVPPGWLRDVQATPPTNGVIKKDK